MVDTEFYSTAYIHMMGTTYFWWLILTSTVLLISDGWYWVLLYCLFLGLIANSTVHTVLSISVARSELYCTIHTSYFWWLVQRATVPCCLFLMGHTGFYCTAYFCGLPRVLPYNTSYFWWLIMRATVLLISDGWYWVLLYCLCVW
jgi:hypothetical protein